jgi:hypothetical protein
MGMEHCQSALELLATIYRMCVRMRDGIDAQSDDDWIRGPAPLQQSREPEKTCSAPTRDCTPPGAHPIDSQEVMSPCRVPNEPNTVGTAAVPNASASLVLQLDTLCTDH